MNYDPGIHHRRSVRLVGYDYSWAGAYSITICTHRRRHLLGKVMDGNVRLTPWGQIVERCWRDLPSHYPNVNVDAFVVMPNHLHGIVILIAPEGDESRKTECIPTAHSLGEIVRGFKALCSRQISSCSGTAGTTIWQRSYHEHVIRSEASLNAIRLYIERNPANWAFDPENPDKVSKGRDVDRWPLPEERAG